MKANFRDISGNSIAIYVPIEGTVSAMCKVLSEELKIPESQLFLVCLNRGKNFYNSDDMIQEVIDDNPEYIIYTKCCNYDENTSKTLQSTSEAKHSFYTSNNFYYNTLTNKYLLKSNNYESNSLNKIPHNILRILNSVNRWNNHRKNPIYSEYSNCFIKVPDDFQQKIDEIAVLGFEIEDIKEALRNCEYNVLFAINSLVYRNSNESQQNRNRTTHMRIAMTNFNNRMNNRTIVNRNSQISNLNNFSANRAPIINRRFNNNFNTTLSNRNWKINNINNFTANRSTNRNNTTRDINSKNNNSTSRIE